jgi:hypothetical protein
MSDTLENAINVGEEVPRIDLSLHLWKPITYEQYVDRIAWIYNISVESAGHKIGVQVQDLCVVPFEDDGRKAIIHYVTGETEGVIVPRVCLLYLGPQKGPKKALTFETTIPTAEV